MMRVKINGKQEEVQETTLSDLLKAKNIEPRMVTVELNAKMVDRSSLDQTRIREGDEIEFLFFMGGGSETELL
ncbi:MAG: sulfur carrier protein ThiS [Candidatus Manganitrophus sp.]|nr:sulfur carrier protein ThiS [Candidatus Manganitrophus sp.]WDT69563.1 MAG: sulfur carrier protein ThiS [Candidatus Manganitrophus sp.]WDT78836.1 MAG: sulfur carrier protein ThiS [Candidatus Manganitrophus sp.]